MKEEEEERAFGRAGEVKKKRAGGERGEGRKRRKERKRKRKERRKRREKLVTVLVQFIKYH